MELEIKNKKKILYFVLVLMSVLLVYSFIQDWRLSDKKFENSNLDINQKEIEINFVSKSSLYPAFGIAYRNEVRVREDLSPRIKRFVLAHELYHARDYANWGGWIGREIRANLVPAVNDPIGFFVTVFASLKPDRLLFYAERFARGS
jgi:hypothetical protein